MASGAVSQPRFLCFERGARGCVAQRAAPAKINIAVINGLSGDFLPARAKFVVGESAMTAGGGKMLLSG